tara:strand:- start:256 stop:1203 length:948 start_codon:yes stop_codon:yes gene_type:complete
MNIQDKKVEDTSNKPDVNPKQRYDLTVREVKNLLPVIPLSRPIDERLPEIPGVITMIMKVKSGKTNFLANMLLGENFYGGQTPIFDMIYIISPTAKIDKSAQQYFREEYEDRIVIFDDLDNIEPFLDNILEYQQSFDVKDPDNQPPLTALVFDDISGYLKRNSKVSHIFSRYRHYNLSLFCANQTCRDLPTVVRSQTTGLFLSSCYSVLEKQKVLEEWGDLYQNKLLPVWDDCVAERFNFCYLKLDDVEPRVFKIGKDGCDECEYKNREMVLPHQLHKVFEKQGKNKMMNKDIKDESNKRTTKLQTKSRKLRARR